ncbi:MAG: DNA-processing protein DprA [Salinisphaera sp.]|jgi:DNA processing protein|nr:DNA-processing protein DprA [Salinisphaera sp.]
MSHSSWLRLATTPGIGAVLVDRLIERYGNPAAALDAGDHAWQALGIPTAARQNLARDDQPGLDAAERWLEQPGRYFITRDHASYPGALADLDPAPPWLYAIGDLDLLARPAIAIVGSRNPTHAGLAAARDFGQALAAAGLVVVSGLARGIDGAAHEGALEANGMTIAVCGTGLDRVYPAAHRELAARIADQGLLVSEFGLGTQPVRGHFPRRNRIIAGLCTATLVVEAARASGSLITARMATAAGREVFALPGSIHNPLARGCHQLIRDGAKLVETTDHILEEIAGGLDGYRFRPATPGDLPAGASPEVAEDDADTTALLAAIGHAPARIDELVARTGWSAESVSSRLLILELEGRVVTAPGGAYLRSV